MGARKYKVPTQTEMEAAWFAYSTAETDAVKGREFINYTRESYARERAELDSEFVGQMTSLYYRYGVRADWSKRTWDGLPPETAEESWKDWFDFGFRSAWKECIDTLRDK